MGVEHRAATYPNEIYEDEVEDDQMNLRRIVHEVETPWFTFSPDNYREQKVYQKPGQAVNCDLVKVGW